MILLIHGAVNMIHCTLKLHESSSKARFITAAS